MSDTPINPEDLPYFTLEEGGEAELIVERSRFIARALPVSSEEEALANVADAKSEHYDARHVCYGFRIGRGAAAIDRANDDGEPARTAGLPIWQIIEGRELTDTLVLVIRYFGGIKLGTGGLARAYRDAARQALDSARVVQRFPEELHTLQIPYSLHGKFDHIIEDLPGLRILDTDFGAEITFHLAIRKVDAEEITHRLASFLQVPPDQVFQA